MYGNHRFRLGLFGANCSSAEVVTTLPDRWSGEWDDNLRLARMAEDYGLDFMLPIGRWKGYGGSTDYQGSTYETITWASGLLAATKRITVFGTVHAPLFHPVLAAKQMVTADHIGHGRFGLNVVCGWNEGEFDMFGVTGRDHDARYAYGQEWLDALLSIWGGDDFDFQSETFNLRGLRVKPKPYGGTRPLLMNAGQSARGQAFALRNCDALFTAMRLSPMQANQQRGRRAQSRCTADRARGRRIPCFVVCRPTRHEAETLSYHVDEHCDWARSRLSSAGRAGAAGRGRGYAAPIHEASSATSSRHARRGDGKAGQLTGACGNRDVDDPLRRRTAVLPPRCCRGSNASVCATRQG